MKTTYNAYGRGATEARLRVLAISDELGARRQAELERKHTMELVELERELRELQAARDALPCPSYARRQASYKVTLMRYQYRRRLRGKA
jgi:hypothetical protein